MSLTSPAGTDPRTLDQSVSGPSTARQSSGDHRPAEQSTGDQRRGDQRRRELLDGENFPVALRLLPRAYRADLWALYRYARHVDDLGDEAVGDRRALLLEMAAEVEALYAGRPVDEPVVAALAGCVGDRDLPIRPLLDLVEANLVDQEVHRYADFDALLGYCHLSADPVGRLVLHVFGSSGPNREALSDRICTGLQLLEHLQDVGEDYAAGRVYLPQDDLRRFGVRESELAAPTASPALRALLAFQTDRALAYLNSGAVLAATLHGWGRLAITAYLAGGRAAANRLRAGNFDVLPTPPKPRGRDVAAAWLISRIRYAG